MDEQKNEIELIDFLNILWKRKWLILLSTLSLVIVVGVISFLLPPKWEIDALIQPGKFLIQTEGGQFEEVMVVNPNQIAGQINQKTYNNLIASELGLEILKFPKLRATNLQDTNLLRVSIKEKDVDKAKSILHSLFNHLKEQIDEKMKNEIEDEIKSNKNKLEIINLRKKEIENEMRDMRKRIKTLEEEQRLSLKKEKRSESESLAMLLYSNEIQQSLMNYNTLNELLSRKKIEEENINLEIEKRKGRIDYTQLTKKPTSSLSPIFPKKKLNILIAGILGLLIFSMLAFFLEYIEKQKVKD